MRKLSNKTGAMELSISTIVIIVIALTMLILGIVLVRSIMCGAISLTSDVSNSAKKEVNKLFEATGGEIQCIGGTGEAVVMIPGKINIVYCGVRADARAKYKIEIIDYQTADKNVLSPAEVKRWVSGPEEWTGEVSPNDEDAKKIVRLNIPKDAPETGIFIGIKATKDGNTNTVYTQTLDFRISRQGLIRATMC